MKHTELRIGNIIFEETDGRQDEFVIAAINSLTKTAIDIDDNITSIDYLAPIPLTEDWLIRFGFEKKPGQIVYICKQESGEEKWRMRLIKGDDDAFIWQSSLFGVETVLTSVHQLQNLYFALTGEELTPSDK